jgi:hypothetical protein
MTKFYQTFKELTPILLRLFQEIEREGTLPNSFYEVSSTVIPKPNKNLTRKDNYRAILIMNIDANRPQKLFPKPLETIKSFGKVAGYKINVEKSVAFLHINNIQKEKETR